MTDIIDDHYKKIGLQGEQLKRHKWAQVNGIWNKYTIGEVYNFIKDINPDPYIENLYLTTTTK